MPYKKNCHDCKYKYSCGYTGCLSGVYSCCEKHLFKKADGRFFSIKLQKEVNEKTARKHWLEHESICEDKKEK